MRALSAEALLMVWETGRRQSSLERALTLLAAAWPKSSREELAALSIGERDARLIKLRAQTFGPELASRTHCPKCAEKIELSFVTGEILALADSTSPLPDLSVKHDDFVVSFRLLNSSDLAEIATSTDAVVGRQMLLRRCILNAERCGEKISSGELPKAIVNAVVARIAKADPHAEVKLDVSCPTCGYGWSTLFDIVSFFWSEIEERAMRLLREVHVLASAYGWPEADILALSPLRRQSYLEMVGV